MKLVASLTIASIMASSAAGSTEPQELAGGPGCEPHWEQTFGGVGGPAWNEGMTVLDLGGGPKLYVGTVVWDGDSFFTLGRLIGDQEAVIGFDDGSGPALYIGGDFSSIDGVAANRIARWDGTSWMEHAGGTNGAVFEFGTFDDGTGEALYAAGQFTLAGGVAASRVAKWDGSNWSPLASGLGNGSARCFAVFDDGSGPALYVGGLFTSAGGVSANHIAKWDGASWTALGSGTDDLVRTLAVHDGELYAGGNFLNAGGAPARHIAKWDGSSWSPLSIGPNAAVFALTSFDDGSGPALYVGGNFDLAGGVVARGVARWDGAWSSVGTDVIGSVRSFAAFDGGGGPSLFGGTASSFLAGTHTRLIEWNGSAWSPASSKALDNSVLALQVFDDGVGPAPALYAGGVFRSAGGVTLNQIGRWDGTSWTALAGGTTGNDRVDALRVYDDGSGNALFAGGDFDEIGGVAANGIAKWDGASWTPLDSGASEVRSLAVYDDGTGPALFVGGFFRYAGGIEVLRIAKWDGTSWSALGSGINGISVVAQAVFDEGNGPALFAGGNFTGAGGVPATYIARWDGNGWSSLGAGVNSFVSSLAVFDDGSGPALYAGGSFTSAGGSPASHIARWDGASWTPLASGTNGNVYALASFDDGSGPALHATGNFTQAGGAPANGIAKWDGSSWSALGAGFNGWGVALAIVDDPVTGPALVVGGSFVEYESSDGSIARWQACVDIVPPALDCPESVVAIDAFTGTPGRVVNFFVEATDANDPSPDVVCVPPSGSFFPRGTTIVSCTATDDAGNQSTCEFPVTVTTKARHAQR